MYGGGGSLSFGDGTVEIAILAAGVVGKICAPDAAVSTSPYAGGVSGNSRCSSKPAPAVGLEQPVRLEIQNGH